MVRVWFLIAMLTVCLGKCGLSQEELPRQGEWGPPGMRPGGGPFMAPLPMGREAERLMLIRMIPVHEELGLREAQRKGLLEIADRFDQEVRAILARYAPDPRFPRAELPPLEEMQRDIESSATNYASQVDGLLDEAQRKRLRQIQLQQRGPASFLDDDVARQLELSAEQVARFRNPPPFFSPEQRDAWMRDALAVLSPEQQAQFRDMVGEPFQFPPPPPPFGRSGRTPGEGPPPSFGPANPPPPMGPGGMGGPTEPERQLVAEFDENGDGWLNDEERQRARKAAAAGGRGGRGAMGMGPRGGQRPAGAPQRGKSIDPKDVEPLSGKLYDPTLIRTLFLYFSNHDWEEELEAFYNTDVDVPATLIVDGVEYPHVGVHFRGQSSFFTVPRGFKRSLNLSLDFIDSNQRLYGYKTLNLLNAHSDPSFLHTVLFLHIARHYLAAPQANFVRVVINGEDWGLYVNVQQFNKELIADHFPSSKGARWKVPGSPHARGGLEYLGEDVAPYKQRYEIKSDDKDESWRKLIDLCRTLNETPLDELEAALTPILDLENALWFLALDIGLSNMDGYWTRASDFNLYLSPEGKFYIIPHDVNETFSAGMMGPGRGGPGRMRGGEGPGGNPAEAGPGGRGRGRGGVELDPLIGLDDPTKPLRSRLLAVPSLRERYLRNLRTLAEEWLDWDHIGPVIAEHARRIEPILAEDVKKLSTLAEFHRAVSFPRETDQALTADAQRPGDSLREYVTRRRQYLLNHPAITALPR